MPELFKADIAQAYPGDEALVAGRYHRGELVIEARVDAPVTGQAEVNGRQLADPQAAQIALDALAQVVRIVGRADGGAVVWTDRDLADDRQPAGVGVERFADQVVDDARAVVLGRVDVIDPGGYRGAEYADGGRPVRWRPEGEWAGELHSTVPRPSDLPLPEREG